MIGGLLQDYGHHYLPVTHFARVGWGEVDMYTLKEPFCMGKTKVKDLLGCCSADTKTGIWADYGGVSL